jgi:hypothetical protein
MHLHKNIIERCRVMTTSSPHPLIPSLSMSSDTLSHFFSTNAKYSVYTPREWRNPFPSADTTRRWQSMLLIAIATEKRRKTLENRLRENSESKNIFLNLSALFDNGDDLKLKVTKSYPFCIGIDST